MLSHAATPSTVLIVDDEKNIRRTLRMVLEGEGWRTLDSESAEAAAEVLKQHAVDLVICDVRLPGESGLGFLQAIKRDAELAGMPVLMISGHASISEALQAVKAGAVDFFEKPLDRDRVVVGVRNALRAASLAREVERLRAELGDRGAMIGESPAMRRLNAEIDKIADTGGRVLITGESGTGKELVARSIHSRSSRADGPFVVVRCASALRERLEQELFGTGQAASGSRTKAGRGALAAAAGGSLLLDEVSDLAPETQARLLEVLDTDEANNAKLSRGSRGDARIMATTRRDIERLVSSGAFREDLYFRLNVLPLYVPPLRERRDDVPLLMAYFVRQICRERAEADKSIDADALEAASRWSFPGNVRELRNLAERLVIFSGDRIGLADLPEEPRLSHDLRERASAGSVARHDGSTRAMHAGAPESGSHDDVSAGTLREARVQSERRLILATLREVDWNISRAAQRLGIERTNLHKKMRALSIRREGGGTKTDDGTP